MSQNVPPRPGLSQLNIILDLLKINQRDKTKKNADV